MAPVLDRRQWIARVDQLLQRDYAITLEDAGLDGEELSRHYKPSLAPKDFVRWFATKYDLISKSELRFAPGR